MEFFQKIEHERGDPARFIPAAGELFLYLVPIERCLRSILGIRFQTEVVEDSDYFFSEIINLCLETARAGFCGFDEFPKKNDLVFPAGVMEGICEGFAHFRGRIYFPDRVPI